MHFVILICARTRPRWTTTTPGASQRRAHSEVAAAAACKACAWYSGEIKDAAALAVYRIGKGKKALADAKETFDAMNTPGLSDRPAHVFEGAREGRADAEHGRVHVRPSKFSTLKGYIGTREFWLVVGLSLSEP